MSNAFSGLRIAITGLTLMGIVAAGTFAMKAKKDRQVRASQACHQPIEHSCESGKCRTYTEAVDWTRGVEGDQFRARVGTCGTNRYVAYGDGFISGAEFFDDAGRLVAAVLRTDVISPPCLGRTTFGGDVDSACSWIIGKDRDASITKPTEGAHTR